MRINFSPRYSNFFLNKNHVKFSQFKIGVNIIKRKLAATFKPTIVLESNGDGSWTITRKGGPKQVSLKKTEKLRFLLK